MKKRENTIKDTAIYDFWESWKELYFKYSSIINNSNIKDKKKKHLGFPEPLLRMIAKKLDPSLVDCKRPYDFVGNIEMKMVTTTLDNSPNSHFSCRQNDCQRLLLFVITPDGIDYYNITDSQLLSKINAKVAEKPETPSNFSLSNFIGNTKPIRITIGKEE